MPVLRDLLLADPYQRDLRGRGRRRGAPCAEGVVGGELRALEESRGAQRPHRGGDCGADRERGDPQREPTAGEPGLCHAGHPTPPRAARAISIVRRSNDRMGPRVPYAPLAEAPCGARFPFLPCWPARCSPQASPAGAGETPQRTVVLLLFDGFLPALLDAHPTPAFDRIEREGTFSRELVPVFPSISLANQTSISTGCWPAHHGIVSNEFLDPQRGRYDHDLDADWMHGLRAPAPGREAPGSALRGALVSGDALEAERPAGDLRLARRRRTRIARRTRRAWTSCCACSRCRTPSGPPSSRST